MGQRFWQRNLILLFFFLIPQVVCAQAIMNLSVQQLEEVYDRQELLKYMDDDIKEIANFIEHNHIESLGAYLKYDIAQVYNQMANRQFDVLYTNIDNDLFINIVYEKVLELYDKSCEYYCDAYLEYLLIKDDKPFRIPTKRNEDWYKRRY